VNGGGILLDTSALLAVLFEEPGAEAVEAVLASGAAPLMSSVNLAETASKVTRRHGMGADGVRQRVRSLGIGVLPFGEAEAVQAGALLSRYGGRLSLGDCACLATAQVRGVPVLTADRPWAGLAVGVEVRLIR
jgi:PIN domain nuclease of toxin-antitoxin system